MIKITRKKFKDGAGTRTQTKVTQVGRATHRGTSSMGTSYKAGDLVVQLSSHRAAREIHYLTMADLETLVTRVADGRRFSWIRNAWNLG